MIPTFLELALADGVIDRIDAIDHRSGEIASSSLCRNGPH